MRTISFCSNSPDCRYFSHSSTIRKHQRESSNMYLFHQCNTKEPVTEVSLCAKKPTGSYNLCCLGAGFGSLEQGWDALRLSRLKVTTVCWITRFLQKSLKTTLILKICTWLRDNWDTLTEDTQWAMRVLHKTSQSHQIPILWDPMVAVLFKRESACSQAETFHHPFISQNTVLASASEDTNHFSH